MLSRSGQQLCWAFQDEPCKDSGCQQLHVQRAARETGAVSDRTLRDELAEFLADDLHLEVSGVHFRRRHTGFGHENSGWGLPVRKPDGTLGTASSLWFSEEIAPES